MEALLPLVIRPMTLCYEVPYLAWQGALLKLFSSGLVETREAVGDQRETSVQWPVAGRIIKNKAMPEGKMLSG